ncbi:hypothetical protein EON65_08795 [archaeon]|nr:MAG: hypothetical protein EON65_08795 [archaeon]
MIKASEGGGGKGIRMANNVDELRTNFVQVQNEVPGSPIFMMQLCTNARHLEVQIVGDEYGNAVALNGRDCSTQRRFQKIFEEGPPSVAPRVVFKQMERAAQRLTQSIGYIGAGTVEYLYNAKTNKFFFLELNPRLQVEHPVTEGLSGVNLPSVQLQVAMGIALDRIPEIRAFYGRDVDGKDPIDFMTDDYQYPNHHVIAARITAENPDEGFKPTSGRIERVKFQSTPKVWGYFSVGANGGIHEYADSQFGHLFATGATREQARKSLVLALKEIDVRGDIRTTVEYLIKLLETHEFKENTIDTSWLDGLIKSKAVSVAVDPQLAALSAAVYKTHTTMHNLMEEFVSSLSKGQTSLQSVSSMMSFPVEIVFDNVKYIFSVSTLGPNFYQLTINDQVIEVKVREQPDKSLLCTMNDENIQLYGQEEALGLRMKVNGNTVMIPTVYNPSELRSDVTGKIVRYLQQDRTFVDKNEPYVEVEAMKMIMALKSTESGVISQHLSPGCIISAGELIASLQLQDTSKVKSINTFKQRLQFVPPRARPAAAQLEELILLALDGFNIDYEAAIKAYFEQEPTVEKLESLVFRALQSFLGYEKVFNGEESVVISNMIKTNKDSLSKIVPALVARKQLGNRVKVLLSVLRQFELLPERQSYRLNRIKGHNPALYEAFHELSQLADSVYGPVTLKVKQLLDAMNIPPFAERLDALRKDLLALKDIKEADVLSLQPNIALSVDLLVVLMSDSEKAIRERAMHVYVRRLYRAQNIKDIVINSEDPSFLECHWSFTSKDGNKDKPIVRSGYMAMVPSLKYPIASIVERARKYVQKQFYNQKQPLNVLHIGIGSHNAAQPDDVISDQVASQLAPYKSSFVGMDLKMVNVFLVNDSNKAKKVSYFNYYNELNYNEDKVCRDMRAMVPQLLEVNRLTKNYDLVRMPSVGKNAFVFLGKDKGVNSKDAQQVLFLRSISLSEDSVSANGADRIFTMAVDELERAMLDPRVLDTASSRLYVNVIPEIDLPLQKVMRDFKLIMDYLVSKYADRLLKLRVDEIEVKIRARDETGSVPVRLIASSTTGGWLTREAYREYIDEESGLTFSYCQIAENGVETQICVMDPYPTSTELSKKRATARRVGSTYANDFLGLLEVAAIQNWWSYIEASEKYMEVPKNVFTFDELVLKDERKIDLTSPRINNNQNIMNEVVKVKRFPGNNRIGMLAWQVTIKTPHYPEGRDVVIIANDVTIQSGSFGIAEDYFFNKISQYARHLGLPRIFISCNSGARIGLVEELKPKFKVQWKDEGNVQGGFEYLCLTEADFQSLPAGTVEAERVETKDGEVHYKLLSIIGQVNGIGVENLRGSGLIAGETSRAYDEVFTLSYVTGRSVGIGAYLNRLGQRVIQMQQGPMILTGYSALNKLLGKEVYTSQDQLGGPQIMYPNGVSHQIVSNDQEGMQKVLQWINYTPKNTRSVAPVLPNADSIYRTIDFMPTKTPYDVRHMLNGYFTEDGQYISGFCDKGSWDEYLGGWGKSVVVGRGRLGGINIGVIAVETRQVEQRIPADPGNAESRESIQPQAGQVWYPDSAFKTAQAINDFNRGENLPLIIFANWRGFSGGTRDMYGEILKYGSMIVDALRGYKHPVFIYIPPFR